MADKGRKSFTKKAEENAIPQSEKSMGQRTKEQMTDSYDKMASKMQPESQKSYTQKLHDDTHYNKQ